MASRREKSRRVPRTGNCCSRRPAGDESHIHETESAALPAGKRLQVGESTHDLNTSDTVVEHDKDGAYEEIVRSSCLFASCESCLIQADGNR
jgi:hypothetical protein